MIEGLEPVALAGAQARVGEQEGGQKESRGNVKLAVNLERPPDEQKYSKWEKYGNKQQNIGHVHSIVRLQADQVLDFGGVP